jgi:hypothetical protein
VVDGFYRQTIEFLAVCNPAALGHKPRLLPDPIPDLFIRRFLTPHRALYAPVAPSHIEQTCRTARPRVIEADARNRGDYVDLVWVAPNWTTLSGDFTKPPITRYSTSSEFNNSTNSLKSLLSGIGVAAIP